MSESADSPEQQLDAVIAQYYLAVERGEAPDQAAFLAEHSEFADELRDFFATVSHLAAAVRPSDSEMAATRVMNPLATDQFTRGSMVRYFGDYQILEEIGIGGMGVVYKARQSTLKRTVALKMIRAGELANPQDVRRFEAETRAAAKLTHPAIVSVHEFGVCEGRNFFTMDFVEGGNLSALLRDQPVNSRRAAELLQLLAEAIHYAHQQGIVHRDLKPANILLTVEGKPRITDFGLAKHLRTDEESQSLSLTETGQILGTAGYMSPEQAAGKARLIGPPADIYALGAVLYAMLTSRAPFVGESQADTILQVIQKEPVPPRILNPGVPRDLETICLKCLEKEPHKRYGTAQLLAEDLGRFLEGRPVTARPVGPLGRGWRWCGRNPAVALLLGVVALSLFFGIAVSAYFADQSRKRADANLKLAGKEREARQAADRHATLAEQRGLEADESARMARRHLYCAHLNLVQKFWDEGRISAATNLLERQLPMVGKSDLRGFEWHYWMRKCHQELVLYGGHASFIAGVAFSADGTRIVTASHDGTARVWATNNGELQLTLSGHSKAVREAVFSPNGAMIATGSWDHTVRIWDAVRGRPLHILEGHTAPVDGVAFSPDGATLASASHDGTIRVWDPLRGQHKPPLAEDRSPAYGVAFSRDGRRLVSAHASGACVWRTANHAFERKLPGHRGVMKAAFSPDGDLIATAGYDGVVNLWKTDSGMLETTLNGHGSAVNWVVFSPDGRRVATASSDETIRIWDPLSGAELSRFRGHTSFVAGIAFNPDGTRIASASWDNSARLWDAATPTADPLTLTGHRGFVKSINFSRNGALLVSGGVDGTIKVWNASTGGMVRSIPGQSGGLNGVAFYDDSKGIISAGEDHTIKLWETGTGAMRSVLADHKAAVSSVSLNPDGDLIVTASHDHTLKLWRTTDGQLVRTLAGHSGAVYAGAFSPDGKRISSASADRTVRLWDVGSGTCLQKIDHAEPVMAVTFSAGGELLASGSGTSTIRLFDALTSRELLAGSGHSSDNILKVEFSPDGKRLATASGDGTVKLWDVGIVEELMTLNGPARHVYDMAFSPDGFRLATANYEGTIKIWNATPKDSRSSDTNNSWPTKVPKDKSPRIQNSSQSQPSEKLNLPRTLLRHSLIEGGAGLTNVMISRNGELAVVAGRDRIARLWRMETKHEQLAFSGHESVIWTAAISPDGLMVATGSEDRTLRIWNAISGREQHRSSGEIFSCVRFSEDGQTLFATNWDRTVRILRLADFTLKAEYKYEHPTLDIALLPGGDQFLLGTAAGVVLLCDARTGAVVKTFAGHANIVHSVSVVDSGRKMLSASMDHTLRLWSIDAKDSERIYRGHTGGVHEVRLLPDGKRFVSGSADWTLRLWDLALGKELARGLAGGEIRGISVAPDGKWCLTAGADGALLRWDLPAGE